VAARQIAADVLDRSTVPDNNIAELLQDTRAEAVTATAVMLNGVET
jgi:hypothetical protein